MNGTTYDTVAEGVSAAGWSYRRVEAWLRHTTDPDKSLSALGFAADLGGETVIVLGLGGFSDRCLQDQWGKLFHGLAFAGLPDHPDAFRELVMTRDRGDATTSRIRIETVVERNRAPTVILYLLKTDAGGDYEVGMVRGE